MSLLSRLQARFHGSLRFKLLALALLPLLLALLVLIALLVVWGAAYYDRLLITKIRSDLAVAHGYFDQVRNSVGQQVEALAASERLARARRMRHTELAALLRASQHQLGLDFLLLLDTDGRLLAGSHPVARHWRSEYGARGGTEVLLYSATELAAISAELAERARTPLISTRNAQPTQRGEETRGMVIQSTQPAAGGGMLIGGLLLNRNLSFVDRLNEIVYPDGALPLGSVGTATLFLDDVRIATNVRLFEGERAIGTRVSSAVRHHVLDRGETWLDRAFVVNDWYVSAYEPITDRHGAHLGMLYVGFLEAPFRHVRHLALALVIALFVIAGALATAVSLRMARHVSRPVEQMHGVMNAIEGGDDSARVGRIDGADELAELGAHFDRLLDRLSIQTDALQRWGSELDGKVADRTRELAAANESLRSAQQRLVMSEKLAAIGQLAAGVAHEVNNPVAVIQGNLDVLRDTLGAAAAPAAGEIKLIQEQVHRIRLIVAKLLQFARPGDYAGYLEAVDLNGVVRDSLVLVNHQLKRSDVRLTQELFAAHTVTINRNELQQVLINLIINALQAMNEGGTLNLVTGESHREGVPGVFVAVVDSGPGISAADRARLFDPFFTTKSSDGNGLGLWISLGIVERYGGRIEVDCPSEGGTIFSVWLPLAGTEPV